MTTVSVWVWLLVLAAGWGVLLLLHYLGGQVLKRVFPATHFIRFFSDKAFLPSRLFLLTALLRFWLLALPVEGEWKRYLVLLTMIFLIICVTWLLMAAVESLFQAVTVRNPINVADNLKSRRIFTQARVLARSAHFLLLLMGLAFVLLTLPGARQIGTSLLASAGVAGLVAGIAARPVLGNFIAGLQIAFTQPIRIDDVLIIADEWGRVEEITATYVVLRIWDERRLIIPLQWFVENIFQNWTHHSASLLGTVFLWVDYRIDLDALDAEFEALCEASDLWDKRVRVLQVTETNEWGMQLRFLVSGRNSGELFDLRCLLRRGLLQYLAVHQPDAFVRLRTLESV